MQQPPEKPSGSASSPHRCGRLRAAPAPGGGWSATVGPQPSPGERGRARCRLSASAAARRRRRAPTPGRSVTWRRHFLCPCFALKAALLPPIPAPRPAPGGCRRAPRPRLPTPRPTHRAPIPAEKLGGGYGGRRGRGGGSRLFS